MKKKEFSLVIPTLYLLALFIISIIVYFTSKYNSYQDDINLDNITYVSSGIFNRSIPIVNLPDKVGTPVNENISITRFFYDKNSPLERKEKSIVYYEGTYMQNTGVDYTNKDTFDVLTIFDGTVVDVSNDELLGKTVKIRHNSEVISVYQGLDNIEVKEGDSVFIGQKIATSSNSKINKELGESMHFEIYKNGVTIDPEKCFNQKIGDI